MPDKLTLLALLLIASPLPAQESAHWAYRRLERPALAQNAQTHPVDTFVRERLRAVGVDFAPEAAPGPLLRRLSLDLIGLPPSPEEVTALERDPGQAAYLAAVDRLLASPRFGERWAQVWLDLARYADTKGYEKDARRTIWRYRDWVIDAFNRDLPFDRFTIEQIAGDLLDEPGVDHLIATAFHRNTMTNDEGGTDDPL